MTGVSGDSGDGARAAGQWRAHPWPMMSTPVWPARRLICSDDMRTPTNQHYVPDYCILYQNIHPNESFIGVILEKVFQLTLS